MSLDDTNSPEILNFSDFIRTDGGNSVFVTGDYTDELTRLRREYGGFSRASLSVLLENAWLDYDTKTVRDVKTFLDSIE